MTNRKLYLDNIRVLTVVLVLIYHVFYIFNNVGILGGIPNSDNIPVFDSISCLIYPWFMVLLFVVAGISSRHSLEKRTAKEFITERAVKLLIPSTLGLFVLHWITGYINISLGGAIGLMPEFLIYPISVISGIGPLWFIQTLFLFSCIILLFRFTDKLWNFLRKSGIIVSLLLFFAIWGSSYLLNMPVLTMYRFGIYFTAFLIGYYFFYHNDVIERLVKFRFLTLALSVISGVFYMYLFIGRNFTTDECLQHPVTNFFLWTTVLFILGFSKKHLDSQNKVTAYLSKNSFGYYILHYPVLLATCYYLHFYTDFSALSKYGIALLTELVITFILNEVIKRIPVIRLLVLGIKKGRKK